MNRCYLLLFFWVALMMIQILICIKPGLRSLEAECVCIRKLMQWIVWVIYRELCHTYRISICYLFDCRTLFVSHSSPLILFPFIYLFLCRCFHPGSVSITSTFGFLFLSDFSCMMLTNVEELNNQHINDPN